MNPASLQIALLDIVQSRFPRKSDAVDALCELLNTTKDPIYRRLRGDTALTPEEIKILATHFHLSLDALIFGQSDQVVFTFNPFSNPVKSYDDYLLRFKNELARASRLPEVRVFYATADIPVFTYMHFPALFAFKLWVWGRTTWGFEFLKNRRFSLDLVPPSVERLTEEVVELYLKMPSTEIWSLNLVDNTLNQIENVAYARNFEQMSDAVLLCEQLTAWAKHFRDQAESGKKFSLRNRPTEASSDFHLFHNEILHTINTVFIRSPLVRVVHSAYSTPNFLTTRDDKVCDYMENWFQMMLETSQPITNGGRDKRDWFFNGLNARIESVKKRVMRFVEESAK